ncbi:hypothetical protein [Vibrio phage VP4B]|uniref:Uncharacterized protein n=1 Tax=Vibrio phage VP4B TaxID=1262540 RepID=V9LZK8_9CAUD|nr:hypothetical protein FDJ61_gp155 [Vibrio phage VP4B]AGB07269.1 hypothetical protein [Vibrio phage VP4B]
MLIKARPEPALVTSVKAEDVRNHLETLEFHMAGTVKGDVDIKLNEVVADRASTIRIPITVGVREATWAY